MSRDRRLLLAALVFYPLLFVSVFVASQQQRDLERQQLRASQTSRAQFEQQGNRSPHSAAHLGLYVFKPASPLRLLDPGVDRYTGVAVPLEAHRQNQFKYRPAQTLPLGAAEVSPVALAIQLVPLIVILLGFAAISGERENGTLALLLASGVSRRDLLVGKALGLSGALASLLIPASFLLIEVADMTRFVAYAGAFVAYVAAGILVVLAVSARVRSSRQALAVLLGVWVLTTFVVPRLAADSARLLYPSPDSRAFEAQIEKDLAQGIDGHAKASARAAEFQRKLLAQYQVERVEDLPFNFAGALLQEGENYGNRVFDRRFEELWNRFEQQDRVALAAGLLSPQIPMRRISMALAGTDFTQFRAFSRAAEAYRREFLRYLNEDLMRRAGPGASFNDYTEDAAFWRSVPKFRYEAPGIAAILSSVSGAIALLAAWLTGALLFFGSAIRNMQVLD